MTCAPSDRPTLFDRPARWVGVTRAMLASAALAFPIAMHILVWTGRLAAGEAVTTGLMAMAATSHFAINATMLIVFAATLRPARTPLVTMMGRRVNPDFHAGMEGYARAVTWAWCGFFSFQIATSAILAIAAPLRVWSFFVNVLDLPLLLAMFASEGAVRRLRFPGQARVPLAAMIRAARPGCQEASSVSCRARRGREAGALWTVRRAFAFLRSRAADRSPHIR